MLLNKETFMGKLNAVVNGLDLDKGGCYIELEGASILQGVSRFAKEIRISVSEENWEKIYFYNPRIELERSSLSAEQTEVRIIGDVRFVLMPKEHMYARKINIFHDGYLVPTKLQLLKDRIALGRYKDVWDIYSLKEYDRFLTPNEKRSMIQIMKSHRGTATA